MADEAVILELFSGGSKGEPIRYSVSDTEGIEKGTLMEFTGDHTISGASVDRRIGHSFAGIAAAEKAANDGSTTLGVWTSGKFDLKIGDALPVGTMVALSGGNVCRGPRSDDILSGAFIGKLLETSSVNEICAVAVGAYS